MTTGEYRVGISFNPGGNEMVNKIKRAAADLIDLVDHIENVHDGVEVAESVRLKALAMTHIEHAAMWAVKAASGNEMVNKIKRAAADLIDLVDHIANVHDGVEVAESVRLKALAMTHIEDAAMWAVKAATKPVR